MNSHKIYLFKTIERNRLIGRGCLHLSDHVRSVSDRHIRAFNRIGQQFQAGR